MKVQDVIKLMDFISRRKDLKEVNIETEEIKLNIKKTVTPEKGAEPSYVHQVITPQPAAPAQQVAAPAPAPAEAPAPAAAPAADEKSKFITIKSPMIGTFYRSPNPESPMFVNIGDKVQTGDPVCIIEAMKLFNEIESEISGTIVEILVENAQPVEFDQPLFLVDPS